MADENLFCKNCDHLLEKDHLYCPNCGQKADDQLTLTVLFNNTISNYFSVDARFFVSFLPLLFSPGYLPAKFIEGKRLRYLHPAQFYLFISVIFFFLLSFETRKQQQALDESLKKGFTATVDSAEMAKVDSLTNVAIKTAVSENEYLPENGSFSQSDLDSILNNSATGSTNLIDDKQSELDSLIETGASVDEKIKAMGFIEGTTSPWKRKFYVQALKVYEKRGGGLLSAFYDTIPIAMFFLLPIYALLLKLFFYRKGSFSHHLVFSFYFFSFLFTVFSIMLIANFIYPIPGWIDGLLFFMTAIYIFIAIKRFYGLNYAEAIIRTIAVSFMYLMFVIPTSTVILLVVSFLIY